MLNVLRLADIFSYNLLITIIYNMKRNLWTCLPVWDFLLKKKKLQSIYSKTYSFRGMLPLNRVNTLLSNTICQGNKACHKVYNRSQLWTSDYRMHKCEYYNMLLMFSDCNSWDCIDTWKYALCYCGWYHPDTNISMTAAQFLRNMKCYIYIRHFWMQTAHRLHEQWPRKIP